MLAEKILGAAVAVDPELVVEAVRGALRGLVERERVTVLVHPDDLELVRGAMGGLVATLGGIEHCEVQAERRVGRGGAVVRTPDGDVDARVETKLERAREVVEAALGASRLMVAALDTATTAIRDADLHRRHGRVCDLIGLIIEATGWRPRSARSARSTRGAGAPRCPPRWSASAPAARC